MAPLVGISLCLDDRGRWRRGHETLYGDRRYARAVESAGGIAMHLPIQDDARALVSRIDALLIPGGGDFPPDAPYPVEIAFDPAPPPQIDFDHQLLAGALERSLPILGICYGMQLLALHRGGTLHHHLPLDRPDAAAHQLPEPDGRHAIRVEPGSRLAAVLGDTPAPVNSIHHQAVSTPGAGLRICARSQDGIVEAIEAEGDAFCLGVQWHPERLDAASRTPLFRALVEACGG
jgi:putative glutamine amidotransferase